MEVTVLLHCKPEILEEEILKNPCVGVVDNTETTGFVDLYVDEVPEEIVDGGTYEDEIGEFCSLYNVKRSLVETIERC